MSKSIDIFGFGALICGVTGGITVVGSNEGNPLKSTFNAKLADFNWGTNGVNEADTGISALGSLTNDNSVVPPYFNEFFLEYLYLFNEESLVYFSSPTLSPLPL